MNLDFTRYDPATGRVIGTLNCSEPDVQANKALYPGATWAPGKADLDADYVDTAATPPAITRRPALAGFDRLAIAADGKAVAKLSAPRPFVATIDGTAYTVDTAQGGKYVLELTATVPARYAVSVDCWPYLPYSAEVTAS